MALAGPFSRRTFFKESGAGAAGVLLADTAGVVTPAHAAAPMRGTQIPGWYRLKLGSFEVTILSDGAYEIPTTLMATNRPREELTAFLESNFLPTDRGLQHVNISLINTGSEVVLVDVGGGPNWTPTTGRLTDNLRAAGYEPEDIDKVVLSHGHPDHIWGLIDEFEEAPRFPNARYYIAEAEWDFWTSDEASERLADAFKGFAIGAKKHLPPLADKTKRLKPGAEIVPGIITVSTRGHTPGHMSLVVSSGGQSMIISADCVRHPFISFEHPDWWQMTDLEQEKAEASRRKLLDMAAADKALMLVCHISFPGLGHVARAGNVYRWVPAIGKWQL